jgi:REP element-mobilizing transposase RayT
MARKPREKSSSGIYHVMLRGNNKEDIFTGEGDYKKYLFILAETMADLDFKIYSFCLMPNHVHMLINECGGSISQIIKISSQKYSLWHNYSYGNIGHLFQDRFKSKAVENNTYFLAVLRYIHQNPLEAGLCTDIKDYKWSSFNGFFPNKMRTSPLKIETKYVLDIFSANETAAVKNFERFCRERRPSNENIGFERKISDAEIVNYIKKNFGINPEKLKDYPEYPSILKNIRSWDGVTLQQLARVVKMSRQTLSKILST